LKAGRAYCEKRLASIRDCRQIVLTALEKLREICTVPRTQGAFYFLLRLHQKVDPMNLTEQLIRQHGVAVIPGTAFGLMEACFLRVAYGALEKATAAEGIGRLVTGLQKILKH
jgi:aspartate/methionine/tyrosine aminotransferase